MSDSRPIGVFDSGAGGLSVYKELEKLLPNESYIYYADSANCPYGSKPQERIIELSKNITEFLLSKNCKIIVVACNTATAAAIDWLREHYSIPFIGMEPAVKPAALNSKTKSIGVLATAGTFKGRLYIETSHKYASEINVCYQVGEGLVEFVEKGDFGSDEVRSLLLKYINPMVDCNIDQLVLGCTHYPFFKPLLKKILPQGVEIIDPAPAVAKQTKKVLLGMNLANTSHVEIQRYDFYSSGSVEILRKIMDEVKNELNVDFTKFNFFENYNIKEAISLK
jgi:glutamate racemase